MTIQPTGKATTAVAVRRPYERFAVWVMVVLAMYMLFDRAAAYIHVPGTPLYIGEATLGVGFLAFVSRPRYTWVVIREDPLLTTLVGFFLWGMSRTLGNLSDYGTIWILHDSALWYYTLFGIFIAAATLASPDLPERFGAGFVRLIPWLLAWLPFAVLLGVVAHVGVHVPSSNVSVLDHKDGDVSVAAVLCLAGLWLLPSGGRSAKARRWLSLLAIATVLMAGTQNRGGMVAAGVAVVVGLILVRGMARRAFKGLVIVAGAGLALGLFMPNLGTHSTRSVSPSQLLANLGSLVGVNHSNKLQGTVQDRQVQWSYVLQVESHEGKMLGGWGPGPNLGFGQATGAGDETLRVPHNSHLDVLARLGVVGAGLWVVLWASWFWRLVRSRHWLDRAGLHDRRRMVEVCIMGAVAILVDSFFDPALEGAQIAALLWTIFGLGAMLSSPRWLKPDRQELEPDGRKTQHATASPVAFVGPSVGTWVRARLGLSSEAARRAAVTMGDQCLSSGSNFIVGVAIARLAGPAGFGAFSLAYAAWILLNTTHRALITDPMAIYGDLRAATARDRARQGFAAEIALGLLATMIFVAAGGALFVAGQRGFAEGLFAVAPWLIFLDLQDYWRWIGFMHRQPGQSLTNDAVFIVVQAVTFCGLFLAQVHSVFLVVAGWGIGAAVGSLFGLWQFRVRPTVRGGLALLRERWHMSRWLAGTTLTNWGASQIYLLVAGAMLGPAALGGLKAAQNLVTGPSSVVIHAGGSFGLPEASKALEERGWPGLRRVSWLISGAGLASLAFFGTLVLVDGGSLLRLLYGPAFGQYQHAAQVFAVAYIIAAFGLGPILVIKVTKRTRDLLVVQLVTLVSSILPAVFLAGIAKATGVAVAGLISQVANVAALLAFQRRARRSIPDAPSFRAAALV